MTVASCAVGIEVNLTAICYCCIVVTAAIIMACVCCVCLSRVFSSYIKEIDEKPGPTEWGSRMPFANLMAEFTSAAGMCALAVLL